MCKIKYFLGCFFLQVLLVSVSCLNVYKIILTINKLHFHKHTFIILKVFIQLMICCFNICIQNRYLIRRAPMTSLVSCRSFSLWTGRILRLINSCRSGRKASLIARLSFLAIFSANRSKIYITFFKNII